MDAKKLIIFMAAVLLICVGRQETAHAYQVYASDVSYGVSAVFMGSISVSDNLVYANLGDYPMLEERGDLFEMFTAATLLICFFSMLVFSVFKRVKESRYRQGR